MRRMIPPITLLFLAIALLPGGACAPRLERGCAPQAGAVSTASGPPAGFAVTQVLTATATASWEGNAPGRDSLKGSRDSGLRLEVRSEVTAHTGDILTVRVAIRKSEILRDGRFIPAPFLSLKPPAEAVFSVDLARRTVDFSATEEAWRRWADGLRGRPPWMVLSANLDPAAYAVQLKDLLVRPILDFSGKSYAPGRPTIQKDVFSFPFLGAGLALGPVETEVSIQLAGVQERGGKRLASLHGTALSRKMIMSPAELAGRFHILEAEAPAVFESAGTLKGDFKAEVDTATGWTLDSSSGFTTIATIGFAGGELREQVVVHRLVETR